jgi:hypothetical protein
MRCDELDYHDDMYPEFAPEPIVIRCEGKATHRVELVSPAVNAEGWEMRGVSERHLRFVCPVHMERLEEEILDPGFPTEAKIVRVTEERV